MTFTTTVPSSLRLVKKREIETVEDRRQGAAF
jgi:hypothetical protein